MKFRGCILVLFALLTACAQQKGASPAPKNSGINVVFILSDDHRYDFMSFMGKVPWLQTPNMDRMAREGAHLANAFVSTSLCSPSRASILTGQYTHHHAVVDNESAVPDSDRFFPEYLQAAGYQTAFVGKWHMGEITDKPRKGFDYWASFRGQGVYFGPTINVNGTEVKHSDSSYVSNILTGYALDFLEHRDKNKPFFLYLSHKAVHAEFMPSPKDKGKYNGKPIPYPPSMYPPGDKHYDPKYPYNYSDVPDWVKKQRYSWHGVDFMYHGAIKFDDFYRNYCETLLSVDESIGEVLDYLEKNGLMDNTVVLYMGDNGFTMGEHGLIDKRQAYEESMRVPLLAIGKGVKPGIVVNQMIQNIDIAPTILDIAGLPEPSNMDGRSFARLLQGDSIAWRDTIYYEYYWERPFPQTPTVYAVRTDRYKFIRYQGVWDNDEFFDLVEDPHEMNNLIRNPDDQAMIARFDKSLFDWLERTGGMQMPLRRDQGTKFDYRYNGTW